MEFNSKVAHYKIVKLTNSAVVYAYYNEFEKREYTLEKKILIPEYEAIKNDTLRTVMYPIYFPTDTILVGINRKNSIIFTFILHAFILYGLVKAFIDLLKR